MLEVDKNLNLAFVVPTKSGNPFHDTKGQFSFAPAGVVILKGGDLLKQLSAPSRKLLGDRAKITKANQLAAQIIDGKLHIVLLQDGKRVDSFALKPVEQRKQEENAKKGALSITPQILDAITQAARNLNLEGDALFKFISDKTGLELGPEVKEQIVKLVDDQRINDLVHYLDQQLRVKVDGEKQSDAIIKVSVGRGFLRKTFAGLDADKTRIVLQRLQGLGWKENILQDQLVNGFPKRLKKEFQVEEKRQKGKEEIDKQRKDASK